MSKKTAYIMSRFASQNKDSAPNERTGTTSRTGGSLPADHSRRFRSCWVCVGGNLFARGLESDPLASLAGFSELRASFNQTI
ncbi:MAG: hypothetical protein ACPGWR_01760 [Ardenticatenaceae bacterium]